MTASVKARNAKPRNTAADRKAISTDRPAVSARRLAANRRNARKSTGPRTAAGKAISCKNAIRHGLTAEVVLHHESREEFERYRYAMLLALDPRDPAQLALADRIISCEWRLRRIGQAERHILYQDPFTPDEEDFDMARDAIHLCQDAGGVLALSLNKDATLEKLSRYEQRLVGQSHRALRELKGLQAAVPCDDDDNIENNCTPCPYVPQWFIEQCAQGEAKPLEEPSTPAPGAQPGSGANADNAKMQNEATAPPRGASRALIVTYKPDAPARDAWPTPHTADESAQELAGQPPDAPGGFAR